MKKLFLFLLLPAFTFAQQVKPFTLKGSINRPDIPKMVFLSYTVAGNKVKDSLVVKNNRFVFKGKIEMPVNATLVMKFEQQGGKTDLRSENMTLYLEPGRITMNIKDSLNNAIVSGSAAHTAFQQLLKAVRPYAQTPELIAEYELYGKNKDLAGMKRMEYLFFDSMPKRRNEEVLRPFILNNPNSPIAFHVLRLFGGSLIDPDKVEPLFKLLPKAIQQSTEGVAYKKDIEAAKLTAIGRYAIEFTQNDTLDRPVSLSSFKGKYVLLDFWASWCGPCRAENPNVVKAFNNYKDKNFTVLSVSLDRPGKKQAWLDAINKDGMPWTHVSDLKYWDNEVSRAYGIKAVPTNLLIDPEGKIVAKNLRGEALHEKLAELIR